MAYNARVRVLLSSYFYPPSLGGVERQTQLLARGLAARGHEVRVLAAQPEGGRGPARETDRGVQIRRLDLGPGGRWTRMGGYLARLAAALLAERGFPEVVQVQQNFFPAALAAVLAPALGALLEAQAHGVPAVVSRIPGNQEIVREGENGISFTPDDPASLAESLQRLLGDPELARRLGAAARARAAADFSIEAMVAAHEQLYRRLIGRRR